MFRATIASMAYRKILRPSDYQDRVKQFKKWIDKDFRDFHPRPTGLTYWEERGIERDLAALAEGEGDEDISGYYPEWTARDFKDLLEELHAHKEELRAELRAQRNAR